MRAEGRDIRPTNRPVAIANPIRPSSDSRDASELAEVPDVAIAVYPTVVKVWVLKKNALIKACPGIETSAPCK